MHDAGKVILGLLVFLALVLGFWVLLNGALRHISSVQFLSVTPHITVVGLVDANSTEFDPTTQHPVIDLNASVNLHLPLRTDKLVRYVDRYHADGFLVNSIKSCNSFIRYIVYST